MVSMFHVKPMAGLNVIIMLYYYRINFTNTTRALNHESIFYIVLVLMQESLFLKRFRYF